MFLLIFSVPSPCSNLYFDAVFLIQHPFRQHAIPPASAPAQFIGWRSLGRPPSTWSNRQVVFNTYPYSLRSSPSSGSYWVCSPSTWYEHKHSVDHPQHLAITSTSMRISVHRTAIWACTTKLPIPPRPKFSTPFTSIKIPPTALKRATLFTSPSWSLDSEQCTLE